MPDFRTEFYQKYVTSFKSLHSEYSQPAIQAYFGWCQTKILPLVRTVNPTAKILELGCGPGIFLTFLKNQGFSNASGIDISPEQVEIAQQQGLNTQVANVLDYLKTTSEKYQVIFALDFIEHFTKDELLILVPLIANALQPGGWLILQTPNGQGLFPHQVIYGDLTHLAIFTPSSLEQLLCLFNFINFHFYETELATPDWKGKIRSLLWRIIKFKLNLIRKIEVGKSQAIWTEAMLCSCQKPV
jgi:2-polyprenyl-3-methyl-5-hydroxy-6-metoxy-1,4-benzoquinol methylase